MTASGSTSAGPTSGASAIPGAPGATAPGLGPVARASGSVATGGVVSSAAPAPGGGTPATGFISDGNNGIDDAPGIVHASAPSTGAGATSAAAPSGAGSAPAASRAVRRQVRRQKVQAAGGRMGRAAAQAAQFRATTAGLDPAKMIDAEESENR